MKAGIGRKLMNTYLTTIITVVVSGSFALYVLAVNLHTNRHIQKVSAPTIAHLKDMRAAMLEIKKLSDSWVYLSNRRDQERLVQLTGKEYTDLDSNIKALSERWDYKQDLPHMDSILQNNRAAIDSIKQITTLLALPEHYLDDSRADRAATINTGVGRQIAENDKRFAALLEIKEQHLEAQQEHLSVLLYMLSFVILLAIVTVILASYLAMRFSRKNIIQPLLALNKTILELSTGRVSVTQPSARNDEIGQMENAVDTMMQGMLQKVEFAVQLGSGNYQADFKLLSNEDKLGLALITMRDDLNRTHTELLEQDKQLLDAQKLARIGSYYYDLVTREFQSSQTLNDILGIDDGMPRFNIDWRDHIFADFHAEVAEKAVAAIKQRTKFSTSYLVRRYNDGKECWVNVIAEYAYNKDGRAIAMYGTMQDITESKLLELELNSSYEMAREQNNRLLNFSYIVSHNLRMHTVNIHSLLGMIDEAETEEERKEFLGYLRMSSDQLEETLQQLNEVVAMRNTVDLVVEPLRLSAAINHTADLLRTRISEKNARIVNNVPDDLMINYNPGYLNSILLNFISNAIKYSHPDRQPVVTLNCEKEHPAKENTGYILTIADNGLGIDLKTHGDKLFGMYKTFHGNKDAKGLGLFMTRYQVEAMDGHIEVDSTVNIGTTFKIYIR